MSTTPSRVGFDHEDFGHHVRNVTRLRKFAVQNSGPDSATVYQALQDDFNAKRRQEEQQQHQRGDDTNDSNSNIRSSIRTSADSRDKIRQAFGDNYAEAGRALLMGSRYADDRLRREPALAGTLSSAQLNFSDCAVGGSAGAARTTQSALWAITMKDWRHERTLRDAREQAEALSMGSSGNGNSGKDQHDALMMRLTQKGAEIGANAMEAVAAQFRSETLSERWRRQENAVQQRTADAIQARLTDRSRPPPSHVQRVIERARQLERAERLRRDGEEHLKQGGSPLGTHARRNSQQQQDEGLDDDDNAAAANEAAQRRLHGMWLRNLLPGQSRLFRSRAHDNENDDALNDDNERGGAEDVDLRNDDTRSVGSAARVASGNNSGVSTTTDQLDPDCIRQRASRLLFRTHSQVMSNADQQQQQQQPAPAPNPLLQQRPSSSSLSSLRSSLLAGNGRDKASSIRSHTPTVSSVCSRRGSDAGGADAHHDDDESAAAAACYAENPYVRELREREEERLRPKATARDAHAQVMLLLSAELYSGSGGDVSAAAREEREAAQRTRDRLRRQNAREEHLAMLMQAAKDHNSSAVGGVGGSASPSSSAMSPARKYPSVLHMDEEDASLLARDSRFSHVWDFELLSLQQRRELEEHGRRHRPINAVTVDDGCDHGYRDQAVEPPALSASTSSSSSTAFVARSAALQAVQRELQELEQGPVAVVRKTKFQCRRVRGVASSHFLASESSVLVNGGNILGGPSTQEASVAARTAAASLMHGDDHHHHHHEAGGEGRTGASRRSGGEAVDDTKMNNIPILFRGPMPPQPKRYAPMLEMHLRHLDPHTGLPVHLHNTNIPVADLHAYQRYACEHNMVIIIRPVSAVVPTLYATEGLHIKGKSINVSLKSSSYNPINGLIPVNPALGKAYVEAVRRERDLEDQVLNAQGGVVTVSIMKKLKTLKAKAGSATLAFRRDIVNSLDRSRRELRELEERYKEIRVTSIDKFSISMDFIDQFNAAQFLGMTQAKWRGHPIYYREKVVEVERDGTKDTELAAERDARDAPVFYILEEDEEKIRLHNEARRREKADAREKRRRELTALLMQQQQSSSSSSSPTSSERVISAAREELDAMRREDEEEDARRAANRSSADGAAQQQQRQQQEAEEEAEEEDPGYRGAFFKFDPETEDVKRFKTADDIKAEEEQRVKSSSSAGGGAAIAASVNLAASTIAGSGDGAAAKQEGKEHPDDPDQQQQQQQQQGAASQQLQSAQVRDTKGLRKVMVVTHRMFAVSEITKRIEPDPTLYMIGPDFDGLCYARRVKPSETAAARCQWATEINRYELQRTMGLVNKHDMQHVREVRVLTDWKQNHGYECGNTVKTQPLAPGPHVVITPESFSVLNNVYEIVSYIHAAWKRNVPLLLNPNWRVVLDPKTMLPRLYGEGLDVPVVDDCGAADVMMRFELEDPTGEKTGGGLDHIKKTSPGIAERVAEKRRREEDLKKNKNKKGRGGGGGGKGGGHDDDMDDGRGGGAGGGKAGDDELPLREDALLMIDKKYLAEAFFSVRRWQLMPPVMQERAGASTSPTTTTAMGNEPLAMRSAVSPTTAGGAPGAFPLQRTVSGMDETTAGAVSAAAAAAAVNDYTQQYGHEVRWDADFKDPVPEPAFEKFRRQKVAEARAHYQSLRDCFLELHVHGETRSDERRKRNQAFVDNIDDYLAPVPIPASE